MTMLEDELGDIVGKARYGLGMSIDDLSVKSDITITDLRRIESYELTPDKETIMRLADALCLDGSKLAAVAGGWIPEPVDLDGRDVAVEAMRLPYGSYHVNSYILHCKETGSTALVDPGTASETIIDRLAGKIPDYILITHGHDDHIGSIERMIKAFPTAAILCGSADWERVRTDDRDNWIVAENGVEPKLGNLDIVIRHVPGHTPGSVCYIVGGYCAVGDTMFAGSIGRPASAQVYAGMLQGISDKILSLPDDTVVLPGHGPACTIEEEKKYNAFFVRNSV